MTASEAMTEYYLLIGQGSLAGLKNAFRVDADLNDPIEGLLSGKDSLTGYFQIQQDLLRERDFMPELINSIITPGRIICEWVLLHKGGDLPVSLVADVHDGLISSFRVYHSTWPLTGEHRVRPAILRPAEGLQEPEVIREYMRGIGEPDLELTLSLFTEDAYAREPSGSAYRHEGPEGRRAFYEAILSGGGIPLRHCTATFDGRCFGVEYILDRWGGTSFPEQAGMAVYEIAGNGMLSAARIYDDISPPA